MIGDPESGYWMLAYTEKTARTCAFIMMDAYDNYRLWNVSQRMISFMRKLNLVPILGNQANVDEFNHMLGLIEDTNFRTLPTTWRSDGKRRHGTYMVGAEFMYYDPYKRVCITQLEYDCLWRRRRPLRPANYPTGYDYTQPIPGWDEAGDYAYSVGDEDDDGDSRMDDYDGEDDDYWEEGMPQDTVGPGKGGSSANDESRLTHVREFLREVGLPDDILIGSLDELKGYLKGRLGVTSSTS